MKKNLLTTILAAVGLSSFASATGMQEGLRVEPPCWWTGMETPLTLMIHAPGLSGAGVSVASDGITVKAVHYAESPNYLFVDLEIADNLTPGEYTFTINYPDGKTGTFAYSIGERREGSRDRQGFGPSDVVYLLMPDRFANGDRKNDSSPLTSEKSNRRSPVGRHGGDLQGIMDHLDYLADLGVTAVWPTPITLDNEPAYSYHGYACSDYYQIDPRYGSNELYRSLVAAAHEKGIKFIQDIVPNHSGTAHWWYKDLPFKDWIHQHPEFTRSNYAMSTQSDPHAARIDLAGCVDGWFDTSMPDMNLSNPYCLQYYIQLAVWWIEYADLDGIRVDTYPYTVKEDISAWTAGILKEYPEFTLVGECWFHNPLQIAYWEGCRTADGSFRTNRDGFTSHLPMVMDFYLTENMAPAFTQNDSLGYDDGIKRIYNAVSMDFAYYDPGRLLTFLTNHDMERPFIRFGAYKDDDATVLARMKNATTLLLTMRGVPQWYYGDEILMHGPEEMIGKGDAWWRTDFPGGWSGDRTNAFTSEGRTDMQNDMFNHTRTLMQWRKGSKAVTEGKLTHFMPLGDLVNTYVYFRYTPDFSDVVMVVINNGVELVTLDWCRYDEIFQKAAAALGKEPGTFAGRNILTGDEVLYGENLIVPGMTSVVVQF